MITRMLAWFREWANDPEFAIGADEPKERRTGIEEYARRLADRYRALE